MLRPLANKEQNKKNFLQVVKSKTGCCGSELPECQYIYDEDAANQEITSITVDGTTYNLQDTAAGTELYNTYHAMGANADKYTYTRQVILPFLFNQAGLYSDGVSVEISADGKTIKIESEVEITLGSNGPDSVSCQKIVYCDYCIATEGAEISMDLTVNDADLTVTGDTRYGGEGVTAGDVQSYFETALSGITTATVVVLDDSVNGVWRVCITMPVEAVIYLEDKEVKCGHVYREWLHIR